MTYVGLILLSIPCVFFWGPRFWRWLDREFDRAIAEWREALKRDPETPGFPEWWAHRTATLPPKSDTQGNSKEN